uniref:Global nitrogen transcriptional regulator n=1 Tax=Caloglossa monosticha TaxID=76906 RepID=A0A1Z1M5E1_9FLOR|nr:global nitrogen transcriptional regulator [Caloglossa monosticha]ARW61130.1 global nitrogen transcriptional regulator [Caloglossa monosticha]
MKWINNFSKTRIPYYIYKLNTGDSILYFNNSKQNQYIVVLEGILYVLKIFSNKKAFFVGVINKNNILDLTKINDKLDYYYKAIALNKTYIISFSINNKNNINSKIFFNIIKAQKLTIKKYELINCILKQKYYKYKVLQIILFLFIEFGTINNKQLSLSFKISQQKLGLITGINQTKVNKIINLLANQKIIQFSSRKTIHIQNIYRLFFLYC